MAQALSLPSDVIFGPSAVHSRNSPTQRPQYVDNPPSHTDTSSVPESQHSECPISSAYVVDEYALYVSQECALPSAFSAYPPRAASTPTHIEARAGLSGTQSSKDVTTTINPPPVPSSAYPPSSLPLPPSSTSVSTTSPPFPFLEYPPPRTSKTARHREHLEQLVSPPPPYSRHQFTEYPAVPQWSHSHDHLPAAPLRNTALFSCWCLQEFTDAPSLLLHVAQIHCNVGSISCECCHRYTFGDHLRQRIHLCSPRRGLYVARTNDAYPVGECRARRLSSTAAAGYSTLAEQHAAAAAMRKDTFNSQSSPPTWKVARVVPQPTRRQTRNDDHGVHRCRTVAPALRCHRTAPYPTFA
ncbi:hypothetical protein A0H81_01734 [Grifola frondosa]|uniref:Uncharacterized protein n=1 Tax=Grifola frondosa TaxID=5627 RepID=A0A1C7MMQ0_GRIFR|nr:hypothetical protein A0H81_01734 [Grifola frondosa]